MITVHHLNNSRSQRVLWLLEELKLPYEVVRYERDRTPIGALDTMIAAHALSRQALLVTHDMREFPRVPGLQLADWTTTP